MNGQRPKSREVADQIYTDAQVMEGLQQHARWSDLPAASTDIRPHKDRALTSRGRDPSTSMRQKRSTYLSKHAWRIRL